MIVSMVHCDGLLGPGSIETKNKEVIDEWTNKLHAKVLIATMKHFILVISQGWLLFDATFTQY